MSRRDRDDRPDRDERPTKKSDKKPAVIELNTNTGLTAGEAFLRRLLPAAVISAGIHLFIAVGALLLNILMPPAAASARLKTVDVAVEDQPEAKDDSNLVEPTTTIDTDVGTPTITDVQKAEITVETQVNTNEAVGVPDSNVKEKFDSFQNFGSVNDMFTTQGINTPGVGPGVQGSGANSIGKENPTTGGRNPGSRDPLLRSGGGNSESEAAVARGLAWLARQQKKDGSWQYDNGGDKAAATGMGLLPFLAAGQTHKAPPGKDNMYKETVTAALAALLKMQKSDGSFSGNTYANAIAAVALCEAFGMTGDKAQLLKPCQAAVDLIQKGQGANGSWGYKYGDEGDTSIVGWQVQALHSAKMCKELKVDPKVMEKAMKFLDSVASKPKGSSVACTFGYRNPGATPTLSAVGLLCRYYLNGWGPNSPGLRDGADYLLKSHTPDDKAPFDMYYYYYATQVLHYREGEEWAKAWNPKMRDMLIAKQEKDAKKTATFGSWEKDPTWIGDSCGRLGTTAMALLTLEVYYRHLPLYNRGTGGLNELDRK
jgi:hypothetical protein